MILVHSQHANVETLKITRTDLIPKFGNISTPAAKLKEKLSGVELDINAFALTTHKKCFVSSYIFFLLPVQHDFGRN